MSNRLTEFDRLELDTPAVFFLKTVPRDLGQTPHANAYMN